MKKVAGVAALLLLVTALLLSFVALRHRSALQAARRAAAQEGSRSTPRADEGTMTADFVQDAWIALLPVTRQRAAQDGTLAGVQVADAAMVNLQQKAKTKADWLVWSQISDYSLAKLLESGAAGRPATTFLRDPDACVSAVMAAMRARVLQRRLPVCERLSAPPVSVGRK